MSIPSKIDDLKLLIEKYPILADIQINIWDAYEMLVEMYIKGGKLLVAGNGGSAADAEHIVGELMKSFRCKRHIDSTTKKELCSVDTKRGTKLACHLEQPLCAIALTGQVALSTAYINDVAAEYVFAQQLLGYGRTGDVFMGITTSGNSENIINAAVLAKARGLRVIGLTGSTGGFLSNFADIMIKVPCDETYVIQELHLPIYHWLCMMLERRFFE